MKRIIFIALTILAVVGLYSCGTGTFSSVYGQEETSYLSIVSSSDMANKNVIVKVGNNDPFVVKVQKAKQNTEKHNGKLYAIKPGRNQVTITYDGKVIYSQEVFLSSQQTKIINL